MTTTRARQILCMDGANHSMWSPEKLAYYAERRHARLIPGCPLRFRVACMTLIRAAK